MPDPTGLERTLAEMGVLYNGVSSEPDDCRTGIGRAAMLIEVRTCKRNQTRKAKMIAPRTVKPAMSPRAGTVVLKKARTTGASRFSGALASAGARTAARAARDLQGATAARSKKLVSGTQSAFRARRAE